MERTVRRAVPALLAVYVLLGLVYARATPPFEASDELWHFGVVQHLAETGELPIQVPGTPTLWEQEGSQPPLYYLIAALIARPLDRTDFEEATTPNPHAIPGNPANVGNKNLVLHPAPDPFPLQGTALAVFVLRVWGILLGGITVYGVYRVTMEIAGARVGLFAAGLTAFNPMFLFISASVNNDTLVTALNSLILWQMVTLLRTGFTARRSTLIAVLLALAALTKLSGLVLMPVVGLAALITARRTRNWRGLIVLGVLTVGAWMALTGWWYARNLTLYGELFGTRMMVAVAGPRLEPFTLGTLWAEFEGFRAAYWGWFGGVNILTAPAFYWVMDGLTALAVIGAGGAVWRARREGRLVALALLSLTVAIGMGAVIAWTAQTYASQGRLLFPFIAAISPLMAVGLSVVRLPARFVVPALAAFALSVPFTTLVPAYAPPPPLAALPDGVQPVYARFGDVELVGYTAEDRRYGPGETIPITVYWRVLRPSVVDYSLWLHAVSPSGTVIGKVDSYPGGGRLRTSAWRSGLYADPYAIPIEAGAAGRFQLRVQIGWWSYPTNTLIVPQDTSGKPLGAVMLDVGAFGGPEAVTPPQTAFEGDFGGTIRLTGYTLQGDELRLSWACLAPPSANYTVFVQVLDGANRVVGQGDGPPALLTRYWRAGESFVTVHRLYYPAALETGAYRMIVGWYDAGSGMRLATATPDNALLLAQFSR